MSSGSGIETKRKESMEENSPCTAALRNDGTIMTWRIMAAGRFYAPTSDNKFIVQWFLTRGHGEWSEATVNWPLNEIDNYGWRDWGTRNGGRLSPKTMLRDTTRTLNVLET